MFVYVWCKFGGVVIHQHASLRGRIISRCNAWRHNLTLFALAHTVTNTDRWCGDVRFETWWRHTSESLPTSVEWIYEDKKPTAISNPIHIKHEPIYFYQKQRNTIPRNLLKGISHIVGAIKIMAEVSTPFCETTSRGCPSGKPGAHSMTSSMRASVSVSNQTSVGGFSALKMGETWNFGISVLQKISFMQL